jgi:acid phosphatase
VSGPGCRRPPAAGIRDGDGVAGGCTRDLVHHFYQEQYQIHGGRMDRFVTGSNALGLTLGYYRTRDIPLYRYLHSLGAPRYAVADRFFHSAFGGSYLSHQWLIAARTPTWPGADRSGGPNDLHAVVGPDGYPAATELHPSTPGTRDGKLTQAANPDGTCAVPADAPQPPPGTVCGDYSVNTIQPPYQPYTPGTAIAKRLPAQNAPTIGDRLTSHGVDWAWYSGGWDNASGNTTGTGWTNGSKQTCADPAANAKATYPYCADAGFQYQHQPFNYYANYAPGTAARAEHLRDETEFIVAARSGRLKPVSFVKPAGRENEHPGYASQGAGSQHLVALLKTIMGGPQADDTLVVLTYDENGGQYDHVAPPNRRTGLADEWGPGTRIPSLVISNRLPRRFTVDRTPHDTTTILAEIEHRFGLEPVAERDAAASDLSGTVQTPTVLSAEPASRLAKVFSATLTRGGIGGPIAGQTIVFSMRGLLGGRQTACTATTASAGRATCARRLLLFEGLVDDSYTATFRGAGRYLASEATAALG